jgi:stage V sporulation protein D (sporulation-specific penicillin-binding protein)
VYPETHRNIRFQKIVIRVFCGFAFVMVMRLAQFSIFEAEFWQKGVQSRIVRAMTIEPVRGKILAHDGQTVLAESSVSISLASDNLAVRSTNHECLIAHRIATITGRPTEQIISRIHSRHNAEWLAQDVDRDVFKGFVKAQLEGLTPGIHVKREITRSYPQHPHAASLVGFVSRERKPGFDTLGPFQNLFGVEGLEQVYDSRLAGSYGAVSYRVNRFNAPEHESFKTETPLKDGLDLVSTIDVDIQRIVREELLKVIEFNQADTAMAVVLDPWTGAILASESVENKVVSFDSEYRTSTALNNWPVDARRNLSLIAAFEPGSTWKPVIMALALENNLVKTDEIIPWKKSVTLGRHTFKDWKDFDGDLRVIDILKWSSNTGIINLSKRLFENLSHEELHAQIVGLGFQRPLPLDYTVRPEGILNPARWGPISIGALAEGYETGVTLMQMAAFYSAIANGGYIVFPHFGKKLLDPYTGETVQELTPQITYPLMSSETVEFLKKSLTACVEKGTGRHACLRDYRINAAGKTGTAVMVKDGVYSRGHYRASFFGFFPAENPHYVILVVLENPETEQFHGGQIAAPVFKGIAGRICSDVYGILPMPFPMEI